jgi:hypothetical protein
MGMGDVSHVVISVTVFIVCSLLLQSRHAKRTHVLSEALSWLLLRVLFKFGHHFGVHAKRDAYPRPSVHWSSLWIFGACIALSSVCRAEADVLWILVCASS